jgi:hypothetical protein
LWHHASQNALPIHVPSSYTTEQPFVPQSAADLMLIAAIEAALSAANWQLIEYVEKTTPNLRVIA